jgi:hypothetical protein
MYSCLYTCRVQHRTLQYNRLNSFKCNSAQYFETGCNCLGEQDHIDNTSESAVWGIILVCKDLTVQHIGWYGLLNVSFELTEQLTYGILEGAPFCLFIRFFWVPRCSLLRFDITIERNNAEDLKICSQNIGFISLGSEHSEYFLNNSINLVHINWDLYHYTFCRCGTCGVGFTTQYDLKRHQRGHRIYVCDCGQEFKNWIQLQTHTVFSHPAGKMNWNVFSFISFINFLALLMPNFLSYHSLAAFCSDLFPITMQVAVYLSLCISVSKQLSFNHQSYVFIFLI